MSVVLRCCHVSTHLVNVGKSDANRPCRCITTGHVWPRRNLHPRLLAVLGVCQWIVTTATDSWFFAVLACFDRRCPWLTEGSVRALEKSNHCGHRRVPGPEKPRTKNLSCVGSGDARGMQSCLEKALIGFQVMGLVVASPNTLVTLLVGIRSEVLLYFPTFPKCKRDFDN